MKTSFKFIIGGACFLLLFLIILFVSLTFDKKDQCLDNGGTYNSVTHTCEK